MTLRVSRLRTALLTTAGAAALALALPTSALAAPSTALETHQTSTYSSWVDGDVVDRWTYRDGRWSDRSWHDTRSRDRNRSVDTCRPWRSTWSLIRLLAGAEDWAAAKVWRDLGTCNHIESPGDPAPSPTPSPSLPEPSPTPPEEDPAPAPAPPPSPEPTRSTPPAPEPAPASPAPTPTPPPAPQPTTEPDPGASREQLVVEHLYRLLDASRGDAGLDGLSRHDEVAAVAQAWSQHLADNGHRLAHNPSYADQIPSGWRAAGENVAWISEGGRGTPQEIAERMHQGWMDSSGHRANILSTSYSHVGIGVAYHPQHGYYLTQVFARY